MKSLDKTTHAIKAQQPPQDPKTMSTSPGGEQAIDNISYKLLQVKFKNRTALQNVKKKISKSYGGWRQTDDGNDNLHRTLLNKQEKKNTEPKYIVIISESVLELSLNRVQKSY